MWTVYILCSSSVNPRPIFAFLRSYTKNRNIAALVGLWVTRRRRCNSRGTIKSIYRLIFYPLAFTNVKALIHQVLLCTGRFRLAILHFVCCVTLIVPPLSLSLSFAELKDAFNVPLWLNRVQSGKECFSFEVAGGADLFGCSSPSRRASARLSARFGVYSAAPRLNGVDI